MINKEREKQGLPSRFDDQGRDVDLEKLEEKFIKRVEEREGREREQGKGDELDRKQPAPTEVILADWIEPGKKKEVLEARQQMTGKLIQQAQPGRNMGEPSREEVDGFKKMIAEIVNSAPGDQEYWKRVNNMLKDSLDRLKHPGSEPPVAAGESKREVRLFEAALDIAANSPKYAKAIAREVDRSSLTSDDLMKFLQENQGTGGNRSTFVEPQSPGVPNTGGERLR